MTNQDAHAAFLTLHVPKTNAIAAVVVIGSTPAGSGARTGAIWVARGGYVMNHLYDELNAALTLAWEELQRAGAHNTEEFFLERVAAAASTKLDGSGPYSADPYDGNASALAQRISRSRGLDVPAEVWDAPEEHEPEGEA